jgi:predicted metal-dependent HD superfamily phosphohydrolase
MADLDLAVLGRDPAGFDLYDRQVREEYAWVPSADYRRGRADLLRRFLGREPLYALGWFRDRFEAPARRNLAGALAMLEGGGGDDGPPTP